MAGISSKRTVTFNRFSISVFSAAILLISISACQPSSKSTSAASGTTLKQGDSRAISGIFTGMMPCADCQQLIVRLTLNRDLTYHESLTYLGKSSTPVETTGKYEVLKNGDIKLAKATPGMQYFRPNEEGLLMLDTEGKVITGQTAGLYQMRKEQRREQPERPLNRNETKWKEGVGFYALGNEPGWNLDMNFLTGFTLRLQDGTTIKTPPAKGVKAMDASVTRFVSQSAEGELMITIRGEKCTESMSGEKFSFHTEIEWRASGQESKNLKGCGNYTADPALSTRWVLETIDGMKADTTGLPKGRPSIEMDAERGRITGHGGCNMFSGTFYAGAENRIITGSLAATKMACENMKPENEIIRYLADAALQYSVSGELLTLTTASGKKLVFKKFR